jgi:hypothetical protein
MRYSSIVCVLFMDNLRKWLIIVLLIANPAGTTSRAMLEHKFS